MSGPEMALKRPFNPEGNAFQVCLKFASAEHCMLKLRFCQVPDRVIKFELALSTHTQLCTMSCALHNTPISVPDLP